VSRGEPEIKFAQWYRGTKRKQDNPSLHKRGEGSSWEKYPKSRVLDNIKVVSECTATQSISWTETGAENFQELAIQKVKKKET